MFSLVDIQESFPNLHGVEVFNKLFKKSHSAFAEPRGSSVHNVWVLPGHIIVSLDEGHKLLAFDLLPKRKPWPDVHEFFSANETTKKRGQHQTVLNVFCTGSSPLYMFIVLKNAEVHVWKFKHPEFEWQFICKVHLSLGKNKQIMSLCFDRSSKTLFWCERRTPTQCCVCRGIISTENEKEMLLKKSDILHNCPPMHLYLVGPSGVLLCPTANSPNGLTMFWSSVANRVQLHMWNYLNNGVIPLSASSDFQSLVTESISLWINRNPTDPTVIAYCTHPVTQELLILESTGNLFSVKIGTDGKPSFKRLCSLARESRDELNQRKTYKIFAFKKFLGLLLENNELLVFETYKGMQIWKSESLKHERLSTWVSQGDIPQVGIWCPSFIYVLVSESVIKQAETMLKLATQVEHVASKPTEKQAPKEYTLHLTFKGDHGKKGKETYVVVDQEEEGQFQESCLKKEQTLMTGSDHRTSESLLVVSDYLTDWNTKNLSSEVCLWLLNHAKLNTDGEWLEFRTPEEFRKIFTMFENPCIFLAMLHKNRKYRIAVGDMMKEFIAKHGDSSMKSLNPTLYSLIKKHCSLTDDISMILTGDHIKGKSEKHAIDFPFKETFESQMENDNLTHKEIDEIIEWAAESFPSQFILEIVSILQLDEEYKGKHDFSNTGDEEIRSLKLQSLVWRHILRKATNSFEIICNKLWIHAPKLLIQFVTKAQGVASAAEPAGFLQMMRRPSFVSMADISQRAVEGLSYKACYQKTSEEQLKVLVDLLLLARSTEGVIEACKLYLEHHLYSEAVGLLDSHAVTTELHDRLFFMILTVLIENAAIGRFSRQLSQKLPPSFTVAELYHLIRSYEDATHPCEVFPSGNKATLFGHLEPLLTALVENECITSLN